MFKALNLKGLTVTVDKTTWDAWLESLSTFIIETGGYTVYYVRQSSNGPKKKHIKITDAWYRELTVVGIDKYFHTLVEKEPSFEQFFLQITEGYGADDVDSFQVMSHELTKEILRDSDLHALIKDYDDSEEALERARKHSRIRQLVERLRIQADDTGMEPIFMVTEKNELVYVLGNKMYKVPPNCTVPELENPNHTFAKEFVDFS